MQGNLSGAAMNLAAVRAALPADESALAEERSLGELLNMTSAQLDMCIVDGFHTATSAELG